jgi:heterodisulfide reductase subunit A-like polyferredoxin
MIYEKEKRYIIPFFDVPTPRAHMPEIGVEERRGNFTEVETGFPDETAMAEAKRCLSCRRCLGCALCWAECKPEAIDFNIPDETFDLEFDEVVTTPGQDNTFEKIPKNLGYGSYANVITDLQFERMLSPTGPTDGMVVSPLDGEVPRRIAIIQGSPTGGDEHLLSSLVLGVNESILALHKTPQLEVLLISPLCASFNERFAAQAQSVSGLRIIEAKVETVEAKDGRGTLAVSFEGRDGKGVEDVDMAVILTKPKQEKK